MEIKVTARKTITGNTLDPNDALGQIIDARIKARNPLETIKNNVIKDWMALGDNYSEIISPLRLHTLSCLDLFTEIVPQMMHQIHPVGSSNYTFTYEVTSFSYEYINTFTNRELLLVDKDTDHLISFTPKKDDDVLLLK